MKFFNLPLSLSLSLMRLYAVLPSSIFCCSAFGVFCIGIDRVSELHVPTSTRKGLKPNVRLIPGDICFLVCCTDFIEKMLIGYLGIPMIQVDGDK